MPFLPLEATPESFGVEFALTWVQVLQFAIAVVLPLFVGLVTTRVTSSRWKAILLTLLSVGSGLLTEILAAIQADRPYDLAAGLIAGVTTLVIAIAIQYGIWKPTGATAAVQNTLVTPKVPDHN